jgi:D-alanine-D-alanine ligase-like ATP-grasp enzyme
MTRRASVGDAALSRLSRLGKAGRILAPQLDLFRSGRLATVATWQETARTSVWGPAVRRHVYRRIWTDAARRLGAEISLLDDDFLAIDRGKTHAIVSYQEVQLDNAVDLLVALHRGIVHQRLMDLGIPVATYRKFSYGDVAVARRFVEHFGPCVLKPASGTSGGDGVTCGIETARQLGRALLCARRWDPHHAVIEQQARGDEYRLLFLDGQLLGIVRRRPPAVVGDGRSNVVELLVAENHRRAESDGRLGMSPVNVDLDCVLTLERSGHTLRSALPAGRRVRVKAMVNQSGAADTDTVRTDDVSEELVRSAAAAARAAGVRLASVEVITPDPTRSLEDAGGIVLEVNGTPGLHYHYIVSDPSCAVAVAEPILERVLERVATG